MFKKNTMQTKYSKPDLKKEYEHLARRFISLLKVCTDIVQKVPKPSDSLLEKAIKAGSIVESVYRLSNERDYENLTLLLLKRYQARVINSNFLTRLMAQVDLSNDVELFIENSPDNTNKLKHIIQPSGERLIFVEEKNEVPDRALHGCFYVTPKFDFSQLFEGLWKKHGNCVSVEYVADEMFSKHLQFTPSLVDLTFFSKNIATKTAQLSDFKVGNVALLVGPPGTGKTAFSHHYALSQGKKLFKLTGSVFDEGRTTDICNLFNFIKPDVVLIDDVDRTNLCSANASSLYFFEILHQQFPDVLFILTANYPKRIEKAMIRSGRIDYIIDFELPEKHERANILEYYLGKEPTEDIVDICEGFSHSDVVSFAKRINLYGLQDAYKAMKRLNDYRQNGKIFGGDDNDD